MDRRILDQGALLPGSLNVQLRLCEALADAIHRCSLSRHQIADELSQLCGRSITKAKLDHYTAPSKIYQRPPADILPAFCAVTGTLGPLELLVEAVGGMVLSRRERVLVNLIHVEREKAKLEQRARDLRDEMAREDSPTI